MENVNQWVIVLKENTKTVMVVDWEYCSKCEDGLCVQCSEKQFSFSNKCNTLGYCDKLQNEISCVAFKQDHKLIEAKPYFCVSCGSNCLSCSGEQFCNKWDLFQMCGSL